MRIPLLFTITISAFLLSSCTPTLYPEVDNRLTSLPTQPHAREVEVFFAGEWPKEAYIKVAALETRGGESVPYIALIKSLQTKARRYGADAVVVQEKNFTGNVHTTAGTSNVETTGWSSLTGIAIKYKRNLDMGLMPKRQQVEVYDPITGTFGPMLELEFDLGGEVQGREEKHEKAAEMYINYIHRYSLKYLQETGPGWSHHLQDGYVVARELHKNRLLQKRIEFDYDVERRLKQIRIQNVGGASEEINYHYDGAGHLTQRTILRSGKPYLLEEYTYGAGDQATQILIYNTSLPEKLPFLRSTYTYYTLEEI